VNELFVTSVQVIGLLGPVFWLGVTWRRANPAAAWCSLAAGIVVWAANSLPANVAAGIPIFGELASCLSNLDRSLQILLVVAVQFGILIIVGLMTRPQPAAVLDPFFARLLTPVGREAEFALPAGEFDPSDNSALGLHTGPLDYRRAAPLGYRVLQKFGIEIPRMTWRDWGGFILAWGAVAGLIVLLAWLSTLGR
jgi:hypothetical protein